MITLVPSYGRDYKTAEDVKAAWEAGKDFTIADISSRWNGMQTSIRDNHEAARIRYNKLAKVVIF